jgi:benzil reductase ((S)-benzoin forming)
MTYFFITGDSSGIGLALKNIACSDPTNFVYGISRRERTSEANFEALTLDLSSQESLAQFQFPELNNADKIVLVNNAGQVGPIKPLFDQNADEIANLFQLNTIAPTVLISKFIQQYENRELLIINISSGAANSPIQGWSTYCSSKAGLDMLTRTLIEDLRFKEKENIQVYSVSPGVIDTSMQETIRTSSSENFQLLDQFQSLKNNNELVSPKTTASFIYKIHSQPELFESSFINLREYY